MTEAASATPSTDPEVLTAKKEEGEAGAAVEGEAGKAPVAGKADAKAPAAAASGAKGPAAGKAPPLEKPMPDRQRQTRSQGVAAAGRYHRVGQAKTGRGAGKSRQ